MDAQLGDAGDGTDQAAEGTDEVKHHEQGFSQPVDADADDNQRE